MFTITPTPAVDTAAPVAPTTHVAPVALVAAEQRERYDAPLRQAVNAELLRAAALSYAHAGVPVLPVHTARGAHCSCRTPACSSPGKHPITRHGVRDATTSLERIRAWWDHHPHANIGLATGVRFDVLDIDGQTGVAALARTAAAAGGRLGELAAGPVARTGNGWHYLLAPAGQGNRVGLVDGVDWRGAGGYIIAPPSRHPTGTQYRWLRPHTAPLPQVPGWLHHHLDRDEQRTRTDEPLRPITPITKGHAYGQAALRGELQEVATAQEGTRNDTLYRAGLRLHSLAAAGLLDPDHVDHQLTAAADHAGLPTAEVQRTIASARHTGQQHPRQIQLQPHWQAPQTAAGERVASAAVGLER